MLTASVKLIAAVRKSPLDNKHSPRDLIILAFCFQLDGSFKARSKNIMALLGRLSSLALMASVYQFFITIKGAVFIKRYQLGL